MKKMLNNMWRSVTALVLVLTMVLGTCGTAFAAKNETVDLPSAETIVSQIEDIVAGIYEDEELMNTVAVSYANVLNTIYTSEELAALLAKYPEIEGYAALAVAFVTDENAVENTVALAREYGVDEQVITEALAALEAAKNYNEDGRADIIKNLDGILACLEENVIPELQRLAAEVQTKIETEVLPELEAKLEQLEKDFANATEAAKEAIAAEIAKVKAEIENVKAVLADVQAKVAAAIEAVENAIDAIVALNDALENLAEVVANGDFAALNDAVEDVQAALNEVAAAITVTEGAVADINAAIDGAQEFVGEVVDTVVAINTAVEEAINTVKETVIAINTAVEETIAAVKNAIEEAIAFVKEVYENATTAPYTPDADSFYVALGDESAWGEGKEYGALVAEELGLSDKYLALGEQDATIADVFAAVADNADAIAKADLITVGISATGILEEAYNNTLTGNDTYAWAELVGAEAAVAIEEKLVELGLALTEEIGDADIAAILLSLVEGFAFNTVEFALTYPELVADIRAINADAALLVVGMYNPFTGMEYEGLAIGEYFEYLTVAANAYVKAYAILGQNTVYVPAPAVEVAEENFDLVELLLDEEYINGFYPNEAGHVYIKDQILGVIVEEVEEEPAGLLGDVNKDGKVNSRDAVAILRHLIQLPNAVFDITVADVNGNGRVDSRDAVKILRTLIGLN